MLLIKSLVFRAVMIHDFATAPRTPRLNANIVPPRESVVQKKSGRAWLILLLLVLSVISLWRMVFNQSADVQAFVPDQGAKEEYLQAASTEEVLLEGPHTFSADTTGRDSADIEKRKALESAVSSRLDTEGEFGFYDSLQASQWEVPVQRGIYMTAEDRKRASYRYILQAASVRDPAEAAALVAKLNRLGLAATYSASSSEYGSSAWYRVNVGPFKNVSVMNKAEDILVSMHMMPLKRRIQ